MSEEQKKHELGIKSNIASLRIIQIILGKYKDSKGSLMKKSTEPSDEILFKALNKPKFDSIADRFLDISDPSNPKVLPKWKDKAIKELASSIEKNLK